MDREDWQDSEKSRNMEEDHELFSLEKRIRNPVISNLNRYSSNTRDELKDITTVDDDSLRSGLK